MKRDLEMEMRGHQPIPEAMSPQASDALGRLIAAQETERSRIARHLHDEVSQRIAELSIMISVAKHRLHGKGDDADVTTALTTMQESVVSLGDEIRRLSHELHPELLQVAGLDAALQAFCTRFQALQKIDVTYRAEVDVARMGAEMALCLYRIAQEALRNVAKHADAQCVAVTLAQTVGGVELSIADDGRGFDLAGARGPGCGLGLISIDERARLLGGTVRFQTQPHRGTRIHVEIPWSDEIRMCSPSLSCGEPWRIRRGVDRVDDLRC